MKKIVYTLALLIAGIISVQAGTYEETMQANIVKMYQARSADELAAIANTFERIAQKETDKWLPAYYAAYSYISMTYVETDADKIDQYLDKAQPFVEAGKKISPDESELFALQALLYAKRITTPMKAMKFSGMSAAEAEKAKQLNPGNPRAYNCLGNNIFYMPSMFGGGAEKALPLYEKALALFETFKSPDPLWPAWGKEHTQQMIGRCKKPE